MSEKKRKKTEQKFECKICDYLSCNKTDFNRHLSTDKHFSNTFQQKSTKKTQDHNFICDKCSKAYKDRSGLWRHKKICDKKTSDDNNPISNSEKSISNDTQLISSKTNPVLNNDINYLTNLVLEIMKQNNELIMQNGELQKQVKTTTNCNNFYNTNNSHNKTFNLNVFLNETCKDAMNIMDFVNSMEIGLEDLEKVGELGYVNGMTNIILKNLKALDITKRPLHCTDVKREIMYIKDENKWEKETENKDRIKKALKYIMHKNAKMLNVFKEKYPDCIKSYSKRSDQYNKLVIEVLGGKGDNEPQHNEKIIRRIAREVTIDKSL